MCLTNHKGTITRHYLLILCLDGGHTNTHTVLRFCAWLAGVLEPSIAIPSTKGWFIMNIAICLRFYQFSYRCLLLSTHCWKRKVFSWKLRYVPCSALLKGISFCLRIITLFLVNTNKRGMAH